MNTQQRTIRVFLFLAGIACLLAGGVLMLSGSALGLVAVIAGVGAFIFINARMGDLSSIQSDKSPVLATSKKLAEATESAPEDLDEKTPETDINPAPPVADQGSLLAVDAAKKETAAVSNANRKAYAKTLSASVPLWATIALVAASLLLGFLAGRGQNNGTSVSQDLALDKTSGIAQPQAPAGGDKPASVSGGVLKASVNVAGKPANITFSDVDMGQIENIIDGKLDTLLRGKSANPYLLQLDEEQPRDLSSVSIKIASMANTKVTLTITKSDGSSETFVQEWIEDRVEPIVVFNLPNAPIKEKALKIEIYDRRAPPGEGFHTHIYELILK